MWRIKRVDKNGLQIYCRCQWCLETNTLGDYDGLFTYDRIRKNRMGNIKFNESNYVCKVLACLDPAYDPMCVWQASVHGAQCRLGDRQDGPCGQVGARGLVPSVWARSGLPPPNTKNGKESKAFGRAADHQNELLYIKHRRGEIRKNRKCREIL